MHLAFKAIFMLAPNTSAAKQLCENIVLCPAAEEAAGTILSSVDSFNNCFVFQNSNNDNL